MYCIRCGHNMPDTSTACPKCHTRVPKAYNPNKPAEGETEADLAAQKAAAGTPAHYAENPKPHEACDGNDIHTSKTVDLGEFLLAFLLCGLPVLALPIMAVLFSDGNAANDMIIRIVFFALEAISLVYMIVNITGTAALKRPSRSNAIAAVLLFMAIVLVITAVVVFVFMPGNTFLDKLAEVITRAGNFFKYLFGISVGI